VTFLGAGASFAILTIVGLMAYIFAPALVAFFVPRAPDVIAAGAQFIRIMCLAWGGIGVQLCVVSAFRASGNMLVAMVLALVSQFVLQFPLAYILSKHTSLQASGLWWSFPITTIAVAIVSVCWFAQGGWKTTVLTEEDRQVVKVAEETIAEEGIR
jgi:Na+-driven multidrug efflux pump